jgi:hypothetical protein
MDQSKKTMRHFYCRDVLWETFEQMANDFDCSIDYLINEAMRYYARSKNYQSAAAGPMHGGMGGMQTPPGQPPAPYGAMAGHQPPAHAHQVRRPPPSGGPPPGPPAGGPPGAPPAPPAPTSRRQSMAAPQAGQRPAVPQYREPVSSTPTLYLIYNGHRYPISKDQFIIGRGSKTSDLAIKDGNISRKHAAVIRRNGTYYIKDLGSTNGIDYKGMRIDNKRVDEGDVFHICDYELRFTYRPD